MQASTLTLLALIIGFRFSMAVSRYDLRKTYEEAEANAIGTEFVRAGLLPATDAAAVRARRRESLALRFCSTKPAMSRNSGRLMLIPHNYRPRCGPLCKCPPESARRP